MPKYDWRGLLTQWNRDLLEWNEISHTESQEITGSGWLGYPGAFEEQIGAAEDRLGVRLPPSYREFLAVTDGWRTLTPFIWRLWSTAEIDWFRVRNREWIDAWTRGTSVPEWLPDCLAADVPVTEPRVVTDEQYYIYGEGQDPVLMREEYLETALEISESGDAAIYLLNPRVTTPDGEWEAWFFANWLPGARRYRSFWEMMQDEYNTFLSIRDQH